MGKDKFNDDNDKLRFDMEELCIRYTTDYATCNYKCEYCIVGHHSGKRVTQWEGARYLKILANAARLPYMIRMRIGVSGEFFLNHQLVDGARELSRAGNVSSLNLITNLSLPWKQYERMLAGFQLDRLGVVASFHPSQVENREEWIGTALRMAQCVDFCVVVVAYPPFLNELTDHVDWLKRNGIETVVQPFIGDIGPLTLLQRVGAKVRRRFGMKIAESYPRRYTKDEHDLIRRLMYSEHDIKYLLDLKKPGMCNAGYRSVCVDSSGLIYRCGRGRSGESIGDLLHATDIRLVDGSRPCPFATCQCDTDITNIVEFADRYQFTGINHHKYRLVAK